MQLNSKGKLARFYMWFAEKSDEELPEDFCTYFWGLVKRAVFLLFLGGGVLVALVGVTAYIAVWIWTHKTPALLIATAAGLMGLMMWLSYRKKKIKVEILSEAKVIIKGKVDAVKNRYCPRIEWK